MKGTTMANYGEYTLLIVDDEEILRETIIFDFKRMGFKILSAGNGTDAFELVKKNKIHLVISDIRMPGGDGMSLLDQIRGYDPSIPTVIFMTGFADITEEQAIARGARKVLGKPFDRKVLIYSVLDALGIPSA